MKQITLYQTPEHECPYISGNISVTQFIDPDKIPTVLMYSNLSEAGFRRSGKHLYRPNCPECSACISIRLPVQEMTLSKSQKRCLKRSQHLKYAHLSAFDSDEHYLLYEKYIDIRHHGGDMHPASRELFRNFLLSDWANSQFLEIREGSKLIACAVYDLLSNGISAVYCYFDPDYSSLSLGKLAIIKEIQFTHENSLEYLYLGYQIDECDKMNYKNKYKPVEQFIDQNWIRIE